MAINFTSMDSILTAVKAIMRLQTAGSATTVPIPLILVGGKQRSGLSATAIASKIISRKSDAGIPVGPLPSGGVSPDELMERIRVEEIIKAIQEDAVIQVAIPPGQTIAAAGASVAGPVSVVGSTTIYIGGTAIMS